MFKTDVDVPVSLILNNLNFILSNTGLMNAINWGICYIRHCIKTYTHELMLSSTSHSGGSKIINHNFINEETLIRYFLKVLKTSLVAQTVKRLPITQETQVQSLGWEDPLEKEMTTHSSTLAWKMPWTEEPGEL